MNTNKYYIYRMETTPEITKPAKKWFHSKTLWFNLLTGVVSLAEALTPLNIISAPVMLVISVAGNTILRMFTNQPLENPVKKNE